MNNLEPIRFNLSELADVFRKFVEAHNAYNSELVDDTQKGESNVYFTDIEASLNFFCETVDDWLRVTEAKLHDMEIMPDDSTSQIGSKVRQYKPKGSSRCDSTFSRASNSSSISPARAKEAARIVEIKAESLALKQRQLLRLKRQEYQLQLKKNQNILVLLLPRVSPAFVFHL